MLNMANAWRKAEPMIAEAMKDSLGESVENLRDQVFIGRAQLWLSDRCAAVTRIVDAKKRVLHIVAVSGEGKEAWLPDLVHEIKDFARHEQCEILLAVGRPGWKRDFRKHGFKLEKITGVCEVRHA